MTAKKRSGPGFDWGLVFCARPLVMPLLHRLSLLPT